METNNTPAILSVMRFVARLSTTRVLERPVCYYGPTQEAVETYAKAYLDKHGVTGDEFVTYELAEVITAKVVMSGNGEMKVVKLSL